MESKRIRTSRARVALDIFMILHERLTRRNDKGRSLVQRDRSLAISSYDFRSNFKMELVAKFLQCLINVPKPQFIKNFGFGNPLLVPARFFVVFLPGLFHISFSGSLAIVWSGG